MLLWPPERSNVLLLISIKCVTVYAYIYEYHKFWWEHKADYIVAPPNLPNNLGGRRVRGDYWLVLDDGFGK